jgi:hypothetical protein
MSAKVMVKPHYVYEYWTPDTNVCFYVGKGVAARAWEPNNRSVEFQSIMNKLAKKKQEPIVKVTHRFKINHEARLKESQMILYFLRKGHPLVNHQIFTRGIESFLLSPLGRTKLVRRRLA